VSAAARAAVAAAVVTVLGDETVRVEAFDPPTITPPMVTVSTAGLSDTEYRLFLRVYVRDMQSEEGQDRLDSITETIDVGPFPFPRSDWEMTYDEVKDAFYMVATVEYPRSDF
jgi:hypothetical protein